LPFLSQKYGMEKIGLGENNCDFTWTFTFVQCQKIRIDRETSENFNEQQ
jgi:hypothetical protein